MTLEKKTGGKKLTKKKNGPSLSAKSEHLLNPLLQKVHFTLFKRSQLKGKDQDKQGKSKRRIGESD